MTESKKRHWGLRLASAFLRMTPGALIGLLVSNLALIVLAVLLALSNGKTNKAVDQADKAALEAKTVSREQAKTIRQLRAIALRNRAAIAFICSTTGIVHALVKDAGDQTQKSFDNHTYDRLVKSGLLTKENVDAARKTLRSYRKYQKILAHPGPCEDAR